MSTKIKELNEFYTQVLLDVGVFDADGEGMLSYNDGSKAKPVTISKKRLCLPTTAILKAGEWDSRIPFHPFSEQLNQGPSPVLNAFKNYIQERLKVTVREIATALMDLAIEPKRHKSIGAKASKFMLELVGADQKTADTLRKVLEASESAAADKRLLGLFLKNGGKDGALRTCHVSFPIMDDAYTDDTSVMHGVKMPRKTKDKAHIVALMDYVLGDKEAREAYTTGSSDGEAPYFHALLSAFQKIATHLNDLIKLHTTGCPQLAGFEFQLGWAETMEEFEKFAKTHGPAVPMLPGNRGVDSDEARKEVEAPRPSAYEAADEDLGLVEEAPRRSSRRDRDDRDDRTERREERRDERREDDGGKHRSLSDILGKRRRDDDDDDYDRRGRRDRGGRDRGRDRDDDRGSRRRSRSW